MIKPSLSSFLGSGPALLEEYLAEQQDLTAVERFATEHDRLRSEHGNPSLENLYRSLLPLDKPKAGQQYAFEVDLDRCTGCKACVTACHNLNGLDESETWRSVGLIHSVGKQPIQQTVTTACQHCLEPGCAHGCPVKAYEKDPVTGVVRHLDDQCIGCQYCILKCPYDVPQYHEAKGIVRKCDMCVGRLQAGEAPACAQACPTQAIRITVVDQAEVRQNFADYTALPGAPDPRHTLPTTRYKTKRVFPAGMQAADAHVARREKAHFPLVFMLVLSQAAAGFLCWLELGSLTSWLPGQTAFQAWTHGCGAALMATAILVSILHLGRPLGAFRAFLGFRRSWLSREIVAFGLFGTLATVVAAGFVFPLLIPSPMLEKLGEWLCAPGLRMCLAFSALLAVHCSAMVYRDTPRVFWATRLTSAKFFLTAAITGMAGLLFALALAAEFGGQEFPPVHAFFLLGLPLLQAVKLKVDALVLRHANEDVTPPLAKTAFLLLNDFQIPFRLRIFLGVFGGIFLPWMGWVGAQSGIFFGSSAAILLTGGVLLAVLAGELLERYWFFTACSPPRMPGSLG